MLTLSSCRCAGRALLGALALALAAPATAGTIFHWQTDDGTYAYSDDLRRVPARYRDQVATTTTRALRDYARFTPEDDAAVDTYASELAVRLERLRSFNAAHAPRAGAPGAAEAVIRAGGLQEPTIEIRGSQGDEPLVVETRRYRREGSFMTRHITTIRQGDELLAVIKPSQRGTTDLFDVRDEETLGR